MVQLWVSITYRNNFPQCASCSHAHVLSLARMSSSYVPAQDAMHCSSRIAGLKCRASQAYAPCLPAWPLAGKSEAQQTKDDHCACVPEVRSVGTMLACIACCWQATCMARCTLRTYCVLHSPMPYTVRAVTSGITVDLPRSLIDYSPRQLSAFAFFSDLARIPAAVFYNGTYKVSHAAGAHRLSRILAA